MVFNQIVKSKMYKKMCINEKKKKKKKFVNK
jgi:hypothetical protein